MAGMAKQVLGHSANCAWALPVSAGAKSLGCELVALVALVAGLRGNKLATVKWRLTNGLGRTWSQNRTFG
jgi:hypothetical protein